MPAPKRKKQEKFLAPYPPVKPFTKLPPKIISAHELLGGLKVEPGTTLRKALLTPSKIVKHVRELEKQYARSKEGNLKLDCTALGFFAKQILIGKGADNKTIKKVVKMQQSAFLSIARAKTHKERGAIEKHAFIDVGGEIGWTPAIEYYE